MRVRVRFFSILREAAGLDELVVDFGGMTAGKLWEQLEKEIPALASFRLARAIAVNRQHAQEGQLLSEGDEVAFFPPVSGG